MKIMTSMDKAGIAISMAVVAIAVAIASGGEALQSGDNGSSIFSPQVSQQPTSMTQEKAQSQKTMDEIMEEKRKETMEQPSSVTVTPPKVVDVPKMSSGPQTVTVSMPTGTSVPGCEETNECFIPNPITIKKGDTVSWANDDTAAHTVTSGKPASGPNGNFDSSLLMAGKTFEVTFDKSGNYDYFCMVHPWMVGQVQVLK